MSEEVTEELAFRNFDTVARGWQMDWLMGMKIWLQWLRQYGVDSELAKLRNSIVMQ